jgi:hypothetical protein
LVHQDKVTSKVDTKEARMWNEKQPQVDSMWDGIFSFFP